MKNESRQKDSSGTDYQLNWEIEHKKKEIINTAEWLCENLGNLIKGLSADGRISNSLGVLQGNGPALDRMIGEYATLLNVRKYILSRNEEARS